MAPAEACTNAGNQDCVMYKHFNHVIKITDFVAFMKLTVSWPPSHSDIQLMDLYGATVLKSTQHTLELQAGTDDDTHGEITLIGTGSLDAQPEIDCVQVDAGPPAPPHILECELDAEYKVEHAYDNGQGARGENAIIHFYQWEDDRSIRLIFREQPDMQIKHVNNAMVEERKTVGRNTVYYLDLFESFDATHPRTHAVTMELSEPTHHPPHIFCREEAPPSPPPRPPKPPPPSPPSPPPPPLLISMAEACPLGGSVLQGHSRVDPTTGQDMTQVIVSPRIWDPDYVVVVAISGSDLEISRTVNAHFAGKDQRGPIAYLMEFDLNPTPDATSSFTFNVLGRQPELVTLQCRRVTRSPPPPLPPPPPPLPVETRVDPSQPVDALLLDSLVSPPAIAALGIVVVLLGSFCCIVAGRRRTSRGGFKRELAPAHDDPTAEETMPLPYTGNVESNLAAVSKGSKWKVSIRLGKETVKLSVPTASAESAEELKNAIAAACRDKIGDEMTPRAWSAGRYSSMLIEYLDAQQEAVVLSSDNNFSEVKTARALHVLQVNGSSNASSDSSSADEEQGRNVGARGPARGQSLRATCEME